MLLLADNVFRFTQTDSEECELLGCIFSAVGYQPTLATDFACLQEHVNDPA